MARRMVKKSPLYDLIVIGLLATMGVSCVGCGESERPEGADHTNFSSGPANASAFAPDVGARLASNIDDQSSPAGKPQDVSSLQSMSGHGKLQKQKSDTSSGVLVSHKAESGTGPILTRWGVLDCASAMPRTARVAPGGMVFP